MTKMVKQSQKTDSENLNAETQQPTSLISRDGLLDRLTKGQETRIRFVESHISKGLAFQIRSLRDREGWSQEELAEKVEMNQNAISRLENPRYGKATITTLKRIAAAFDVALVVRFIPFSHLVDWVTATPRVERGLSPSALAIPSFEIERASMSATKSEENDIEQQVRKQYENVESFSTVKEVEDSPPVATLRRNVIFPLPAWPVGCTEPRRETTALARTGS